MQHATCNMEGVPQRHGKSGPSRMPSSRGCCVCHLPSVLGRNRVPLPCVRDREGWAKDGDVDRMRTAVTPIATGLHVKTGLRCACRRSHTFHWQSSAPTLQHAVATCNRQHTQHATSSIHRAGCCAARVAGPQLSTGSRPAPTTEYTGTVKCHPSLCSATVSAAGA
jgi:hypothetical protein